MVLRLRSRYYRTIPIDRPGPEFEDLELNEDRTALVVMHCWNIGCPDGPDIENDYWVGMGFPEVHREAEAIMKDRIRPAMDAAREIGMAVCHVESQTIERNRSRRGKEPAEDREPWGWRERMAWRYHGRDYEHRSPLIDMDRAKAVAPLQGEPFVYRTADLVNHLKERGIENLIYSGFATDMCILRAPGGIEDTAGLDYRVFLIRDATLGVEFPDTLTERLSTGWAIRFFESHFGDTITTEEFIEACRSAR